MNIWQRILSVVTLLFFLTSFLAFYPSNADAEIYSSISGSVKNSVSKEGIKDVLILVISSAIDSKVRLFKTKTDEKGNYNIEVVPSGEYTLSVIPSVEYYSNFEPRNITIIQGKNIVNLNFELSKKGSISGVAYKSDGVTPMINTPIFVSTSEGSFENSITNENGNFLISNLSPSENTTLKIWTFGQFSINLYGINILSQSITQNVKVVFSTDTSISLTGTVTSSQNFVPIKDAVVTIVNENGIGIANTDNEGKYSIRGVSPGIYDVSVFGVGYQGEEEPIIEEKAVNITLGSITTKDFVLIPQGSLSSNLSITSFSATSINSSFSGGVKLPKWMEKIVCRFLPPRLKYYMCCYTAYAECLSKIKTEECSTETQKQIEACEIARLLCAGLSTK